MNRIDRLFGLLVLLQSKKYVTAEEIAERFTMSIRTVYRDIKALSEQGIPVCFQPHRGYSIMQGFFLPPVSFSSDEANALLLMEPMVQSLADKSIQNHYSNAVVKVRSVLKSSQKENAVVVTESIKTQFPKHLSNDVEYLSLLQHCISHKSTISLTYTNNKGEQSERCAEPIGLIFYAFGWHLIAWCQLRNEYRDFKVVRITSLNDTGQPFKKDNHIPLEEYMKSLPVTY